MRAKGWRPQQTGHKMDAERAYIRYSVWDNRDDRLLVCDLPARRAAALLGVRINYFCIMLSRQKQGRLKKYTITSRYADEKDDG